MDEGPDDRAVSADLRTADLPEEPLPRAQALHARGVPRAGDAAAGRGTAGTRRVGAARARRDRTSARLIDRLERPRGALAAHLLELAQRGLVADQADDADLALAAVAGENRPAPARHRLVAVAPAHEVGEVHDAPDQERREAAEADLAEQVGHRPRAPDHGHRAEVEGMKRARRGLSAQAGAGHLGR